MTTVVSAIRIQGPVEAVFDLVTSARLWPDWHPATLSVDRAAGAGGNVVRKAARPDPAPGEHISAPKRFG